MLSRDSTQWLEDRVGTIHTFQGREADTVILLLGASAESQNGAREWTAGTPNISDLFEMSEVDKRNASSTDGAYFE